MIFRTVPLVLFIIAATTIDYGQTKRPRRVGNLPTIKESVTVKGDFPPTVKLPKETDQAIWKEFGFAEHGVRLSFPSTETEPFENEVADIDGIWTYSAVTEHATYRLLVRGFSTFLDDDELSETLDSSISLVYQESSDVKLKMVRQISYEGKPGREFIVEEKNKVQAVRIFVLNQKLILMFVTVEPKAAWPRVETWAKKFFESLKVESQLFNIA
jgi:hypothetical protein